MAKYGTSGGVLFQPLEITKAGATPPSLHFAKKGKITKVAPAFYAHDPEVFKTRLVDEGWGTRLQPRGVRSVCYCMLSQHLHALP
jgi:hypothetical protein